MENDIKTAKRLLSSRIEDFLRCLGEDNSIPRQIGNFDGELLTLDEGFRVDENRVHYMVRKGGLPMACLEVGVKWRT